MTNVVDQKLEFIATDQTEASTNAPVPSGDNKFWEVELDYPFDNTRTINSYLRIGTFEANPALQFENNEPIPATSASSTQDANSHRGHDLAAMIVDFYDDSRDRGSDADLDPFFTDPAEREAESALLHTKGGWRDHSDGTRITTTRGDKIEVIRGNYQMVVLGRQDQLANQSRYEAGGGHFSRDNDNLTPGAIFKISWVRDKFNGTWKVVEETTKGDYLVRYHGDVEEEYFGNSIVKTIGGEINDEQGENNGGQIDDWESAPDPNVTRKNPTIHEITFAESITIQRGSNKSPVLTVTDASYADTHTVIGYTKGTTTDKNYSNGEVRLGTFSKGTITEERRGGYFGRFNGNSREYWGLHGGAPDDIHAPDGFEHVDENTNFLEVFGVASQSMKVGFFMELLTPLTVSIMLGMRIQSIFGYSFEYSINKLECCTMTENTNMVWNKTYAAASWMGVGAKNFAIATYKGLAPIYENPPPGGLTSAAAVALLGAAGAATAISATQGNS